MIAVLGIALGIGIWSLARQSPKYPGPVEKITVAASASGSSTLVFIAQDHGYFREHGLAVTIKEYEAGKLAADALLVNAADIATCAEFVLVSQSFDTESLRVLGTVAIANVSELIARKDRGIQYPSDLRRKKIGVTRKSAGEFFLGRFLLLHDLSLPDIEVIDLTPSEIVEALAHGTIDAALTWEPHIYAMKNRLGAKVVTFPGQNNQDFYFLLMSKAEWIKTHPSTVERFLKALVQAEHFVHSHPADAQKFIAQRFHYEETYIQSVWKKYRFVVTLPQALLLAMEDEARWLRENQLTARTWIPNYLHFIYIDGLEAVKPKAVTLIH